MGYQTIRIKFDKDIDLIDEMFNDPGWCVSTLSEWIEKYKSTRFTQINTDEAIITSEYNHDHIYVWLVNNTPINWIEMD